MSTSLGSARQLFLVGRGASLAAAGTGALIIKESDHFPAEAMSSAAFRHGPFEMVGPDSLVLIFEGDKVTRYLNAHLFTDVRTRSDRVAMVASSERSSVFSLASCPEAVRPILEILPVQMITLTLAAQMGREAGIEENLP